MTIQFENQPTKAASRGSGKARRPGTIFGRPTTGKNNSDVRLFTPCADRFRLLETMNLTARSAAFGDVILISPACSSFDQFRIQPKRGEVYQCANGRLADATGSMSPLNDPNTQADGKIGPDETEIVEKKVLDLHRGFLRQNPGAKTKPNPTSLERTPTSANHK
jgi:hypothetical protein